MVRMTVLIVCILWLTLPSVAATVTVSQTMYEPDNVMVTYGPFFVVPNWTLDHPPYHRGQWEDWGWTHNMTGLAPADATGIASATLSIRAWEVDASLGEDDYIYANGTLATVSDATTVIGGTVLGTLGDTGGRVWGTTSLDLPENVRTALWNDGTVDIAIDIDKVLSLEGGHRVTLFYSTLTVNYTVPDTTWDPDLPVYRFWSPTKKAHFYTKSETEKNKLINLFSDVWTYEKVAYYTYPDKRSTTVSPVYRFWSSAKGSHFYTISEGERNKLLGCPNGSVSVDGYSTVWTYEGIAFHAHPAGQQPVGAAPVYRFWSASLGHHFYTLSEGEKNKLINLYPDVWAYEGIAWYAYE